MHDLNNDLTLLYSNEINGYTILKYERNLILCDPDDRTIEVLMFLKKNKKHVYLITFTFYKRGSPYVIYAWSDSDPISEEPEDLKYHSINRGSKQIVLIDSLKNDLFDYDDEKLEKVEFKINNVS